ncbi:MAG TPA: glutamate--tRNA ligase [Longimicrobiaceae bacterium]
MSAGSAPRFRFAPSPTGQLHVGNARTAILNWLLARHHGGAFVLRIEDTDVERNVADAETAILEDLRWLGMDWDEGPEVGGPYGPYRQSERVEEHRAAAEALLRSGNAYVCTCPPAPETGAERRERCPCADRGDIEWRPGTSVRFRVPDREVRVVDQVRGEVVFPAGSIEDFVLLRGNGRATYNLAVTVDDAAMRITHVVRAVDHLTNTPKQLLIYGALGKEPPVFAHIPLILGEDRQKLSKRHGATSVGEHRQLGFMPEALFNYLSLLSWSSPSGEEYLPRERLIEEVDLGRVGSSDAIFDREKLRWLSSRYIQELPTEVLAERLRDFLNPERFGLAPEQMTSVAELLRKRISILSEAEGQLASFLNPLAGERRAAREAALADPAARQAITAVRARLEALPEWTEADVDAAIRGAGKDIGIRGRALFQPVRLALTGEEHGPELGRVAYLLGRERALARLKVE